MIPGVLPDNLIGFLVNSAGGADLLVYLVLFIIIFLENGVPPMIWLPGDSLLFLSGMLAAGEVLDLPSLLMTYMIAAYLGYQVSYYLGRHLGLPLITKRFSRIITEKNLERSQDFYHRWGNTAITIGRFIPVIRTMTPFLAGISSMNPRHFSAYNILGALIWPPLVCGFGYGCGVVPWLATYRGMIFTVVSVLFAMSILGSLLLILCSWIRTR